MAAAAAVAAGSFPGVPRVAETVLERGWCSPSSYAQARQARARHQVKLSRLARANLAESEQAARRHQDGCRRAETLVSRRARHLPRRAPWIRGSFCPRSPIIPTPDWRRAVGAAALALESRAERPIIVQTVLGRRPVGRQIRSARARMWPGGRAPQQHGLDHPLLHLS